MLQDGGHVGTIEVWRKIKIDLARQRRQVLCTGQHGDFDGFSVYSGALAGLPS